MTSVSKKITPRKKTVAETASVKTSRSKKTAPKTSELKNKPQKISLLDLKPVKISRSRKTKETKNFVEVTLPKEPPLRLLNKINYLNYISSSKTTRVMSGVASFSGYTFIVAGLYLSFMVTDIKTDQTHNLLATTVCSDDSCFKSSSLETATTSSFETSSTLSLDEKVVPTIIFPSNFPTEPKESFIFTLEVTDITDIKLFIFSSNTGEEISLSLKNKEGNKYSFYVPYDILKSSTYTFKLKTLSIDKSSYYFNGPEFTVSKDDIVTDAEIITDSSFLATDESSSTLALHEPHLKLENIIDGKYKFVTLNANDYLRVEMYALPSSSVTPIFLGKAILKDNVWLYFLDGSTLPVNNYNIFAKAIKPDSTHKTNLIGITIKKLEIASTETISTDNEIVSPLILTQKVKETAEQIAETDGIENNLIEQRQEYYQENLEKTAEKSDSTEVTEDNLDDISSNSEVAKYTAEEQAEREADRLLNEVDDELNNLLQKYASSLQGGDENVKRLALNELFELRNSLIMKTKMDTGTKDISEQIALILNTKFEILQETVLKYETLLKERSELISKDTDEDGITDFDEANLYKTNPNLPDTDGDGVIDSIEITSGFDPLSSNSEAIVNFQSPKEVNYTDEKNLIVESVTSVTEVNDNQNEKMPLMAEIRGKALPNSFVTLFIYSSPTIVTVKADSDGNFVYTLEKELEEGEHEIYVAMTDNTGSIVARSKPFQFIKTAEAFTPVDVENQAVVQTDDTYQDTELSSYNTVAAMGVISFGLILLMLGHTLRNRPEEEIKQHDSDS